MNLVINGAEAIGERPGMVTVRTAVRELDGNGARAMTAGAELRPGHYLVVEVVDTGCGMDDGTAARIFDPFFSTKFTGRGLGLAAALGIVRGHRGALQLRTVPGQGSTFTVWFPPTSAAATPERRPAAPPPRDGRGTALVVDDEDLVRGAARAVLERFGYTVVAAENGERAVELFADIAESVAVVLLDLTLPVLSGEETLQRLKNIRPGVPVLLSSGLSEIEALRRFRAYGLAGFLQKPYTASALAEKVRSVAGNA